VTLEAAARKIPWQALLSELIGVALLLLFGLSFVILMFGRGSPMASIVPNEGARRAITGFLFGTVGGLIALSRVGKVSGAHINPVVTLGFWLMGKIKPGDAAAYVLAQLLGAAVGCLPLLAWGAFGRTVAFGATLPGDGFSTRTVLLGEVVTTFALIAGLCVFLGFRPLRRFTPALMPPLYSFMVWAEAPISGTSTNPARSFGPAIVSGRWDGFWIYWIGPILGALLAVVVCSRIARRISIAKLYHFDSDPHRIFGRVAPSDSGSPARGKR
jgi:aquaporin Z